MEKTFIFIGRSGCGKGTQIAALKEHLTNSGDATQIFTVGTGDRFREFVAGTGYAHVLAREIYEHGSRQPDFLAVHMWATDLIAHVSDTADEHLIFDGTPRSLSEAQMLDTALRFFKRSAVAIVFLNVSRAWATEHLLGRGRGDDDAIGVQKRLDWYDNDVAPAVEYFRSHPVYRFVEVDGEQAPEEVTRKMIAGITA